MVENLNIPVLSAVARVRPLHFKILHNEIVSSKVLLTCSYVANDQADRLINFTISVQQTGKGQNVYEIAFKCGSVVFLPR